MNDEHIKLMDEIVSRDDLFKAYGNADFGPHATPYGVVKETLLKHACGYHSGSTARRICIKLGLMKTIGLCGDDVRELYTLTPDGFRYLYAAI